MKRWLSLSRSSLRKRQVSQDRRLCFKIRLSSAMELRASRNPSHCTPFTVTQSLEYVDKVWRLSDVFTVRHCFAEKSATAPSTCHAPFTTCFRHIVVVSAIHRHYANSTASFDTFDLFINAFSIAALTGPKHSEICQECQV